MIGADVGVGTPAESPERRTFWRVSARDDPLAWLLPLNTAICLQRDCVGERGAERFVGLGEAGGRNLRHGLDGVGEVDVGEPRVQALKGRGEAAGENGLLETRASGFDNFGGM